MDIAVLLFIVLFAASAVIVARVIISMHKRHRDAEEEECRRKAEEKRKLLEDVAQQKAKAAEQKRLAGELQKAEEDRKRKEEEAAGRKAQEEQHRKAEEERKHREEEERRVEDEVRRKAEEEAWRRKEEEERKRREEEESRRRAEEEERCQREDEKRGRDDVEKQQKEKISAKKPLPPDKRGGRPRGSTGRPETEQTPETKPRSLKPEIVCWNEGWNWVIGIEVPEELETQSVAQNEQPLEYDNTDEKRYRLKHAEGRVKITWTGGEKDIPLVRPERNYLIFKMRKDWKGLGRLVMHPTTGYYLAIVPQDWKRDEEVSDPASVNPESVQLDGYKAHFFY